MANHSSPQDPSIPEPEFITGDGEYRAGLGAIVTGWCRTKEEARAAYYAAYRASLANASSPASAK